MNNLTFLASVGVTDGEVLRTCLAAMEKYSFHWWEPGVDDRTYAYYQINEDIYLSGDSKRLGNALPLLLGRPVYGPMVELHPANIQFTRAEAERAWTQGTPTHTDEEIELIYARLFTRMQGWGTNVIAVDVQE